jgi:hypothetical protein
MATDREPYVTPLLIRHGSLETLTSGAPKGTQGATDKSSAPNE